MKILFHLKNGDQMDAMETILTRRSVRNYINKKVPEKIISELLNAAVSAPSAGNEQPWHFVIIDKKEILDEVTTFHPNAKMLLEAPLGILVCGDLGLESFKGYWMLDCSAATQNILLSARALGLGACWLGIYPRNNRITKIKEMMKLPDNIIPFALISIGYTKAAQKVVKRLDEFRIHKNQW
jgi:nitroreductase